MMAEFEILPVLKEDTDAVIRLLDRSFYNDEPLNKAIGLCEISRCIELDQFCIQVMHEGLSFKAVDKEGNIVGVLINGISPLKEDEENNILKKAERCKNPKYKKILYILAQREDGSRVWEKFPQDEELVDVKIAATDPEWRRKGIMNELLKETEKAALLHGVRLLRIDCSSVYSAKSAERLGFTCIYSARYTDIKMDGQPLIVPEPPHLYERVYIKPLYGN